MTKTSLQVIERAHQRIRVLGTDDPVTAEMQAVGTTVLEGLFEEISTEATIAWDLTTVPDNVWIALSDYLAACLAGEYNRPFVMSRPAAYLKLMQFLRPDDTDDRRDTNDDDVISEAEEVAGREAAFY